MIGKTVLVVDPNPATQQRVHEAFRPTGFVVLRAASMAEAQQHAAKQTIDLVFSTVRLPNGHTGYDLARALRDRHPAALVYLLAGGFDVYDAQKAAEAGVDGRISVPFTPRSLIAKVEEALGPIHVSTPPPEPAMRASAVVEPVEALPVLPVSAMVEAAPVEPPPVSEERLATFLPRDFRRVEPVSIDPATIGPAIERAVMEVLPEVVEGILRNALVTSPTFRDLVKAAVTRAVTESLADNANRRR